MLLLTNQLVLYALLPLEAAQLSLLLRWLSYVAETFPDPRVRGGGIRTLLDAGIEVTVGCEEAACREINADFIARNTKKRR